MFTLKFTPLIIDKKGWTEALGTAIDVQIRQAAREWLRAVVQGVPVYSGQARGSLLPLGRFLRVAIPISPDPIGQRRYPGGISLGESQGDFKFFREGQSSLFSFSTEVPHFLINEFNIGLGSPPLRHPTPWLALSRGQNAFRQYLLEHLKERIPKILDYLVTDNG